MSELRGKSHRNAGIAKQMDAAALRRDFIWSLLWQLTADGTAAYARDVYDAWLDGRTTFGCAYYPDYLGNQAYFTHLLNRLVKDGRARVSRAKGRHPLYEAIG